jgi:hypothetical protein
MNLDQATTVLAHAKDDPLHAYVVLSLMVGVRKTSTAGSLNCV